MMKNFYEFFKIPVEESIKQVGIPFTTKDDDRRLYFPIEISEYEFNYGKKIGLISVSYPCIIRYKPTVKNEKWFRIGVASPDDDDREIDLYGFRLQKHRNRAINILKNLSLNNVSFGEVFDFILDELKQYKSFDKDITRIILGYRSYTKCSKVID